MDKYKRNSLSWDNSNAIIDRYIFSDAIYIEFTELNTTDYSIGTYKGANQFRIDYTKIGRFECEFLDHTYSYRGENEITILTTTESGKWTVSASIPTNVYHGCVLVIEYEKLSELDKQIFSKFGIDIEVLTQSFHSSLKWHKITEDISFNTIFHDMYKAGESKNCEMIFMKGLELLVLLSSQNKAFYQYPPQSDYLPSEQVDTIRKIHRIILEQYNKPIRFESLSSEFNISYSRFNSSFKRIYGDTPYQYLKKVRMNIAAQKLVETNLNIVTIAYAVGYNNVSKFSSAFKSVMGELPHIYRKQK